MDKSISNVLEALYLDSDLIKKYVDAIVNGNRAPYDILAKSSDNIKNEEIVARVRTALDETIVNGNGNLQEILREILDIAMTIEYDDGYYEVCMFNGDTAVDGTKQIVKADKVADLKNYAKYKGFEFTVRKTDG